jgi:hypothetical protein
VCRSEIRIDANSYLAGVWQEYAAGTAFDYLVMLWRANQLCSCFPRREAFRIFAAVANGSGIGGERLLVERTAFSIQHSGSRLSGDRCSRKFRLNPNADLKDLNGVSHSTRPKKIRHD